MVVENYQSANAIGHAFNAGVFTVQCDVLYKKFDQSGNVIDQITVEYKGDVAVIGGPITVSVTPGETDVVVWKRDNKVEGNPWYIQFFRDEVASQRTTDWQRPQNATAGVMRQPPGTSITWTVPEPLYSRTLNTQGVTNPTSIDVEARGVSGTKEVTTTFQLSFTGMHGHTASASGEDDTDSTPDETVTTAEGIMMTSKLTPHHPITTQKKSSTPIPPPLGKVGAGEQWFIYVMDQTGKEMPGVWVQERFITALPPNFLVNPDRSGWATNWDGFFGPDNLKYFWNAGVPPSTQISVTHEYWAATYRTIQNAGGLRVGTWTLTISAGGAFSHIGP
jgi:hypothetical protein